MSIFVNFNISETSFQSQEQIDIVEYSIHVLEMSLYTIIYYKTHHEARFHGPEISYKCAISMEIYSYKI